MPQYAPWYLTRKFPVFCDPCIPAYLSIFSVKKCILITGVLLFGTGIMILLGLLLVCIAVACSTLVGALLPVGLLLIILGILLFHCGWAAHLLDDDRAVEVSVKPVEAPIDPELEIFQSACREPKPEIKQGYWQFEEKAAWQTVANPYPIQLVILIDLPDLQL
uniref:Palmitoyltransferase n=1 Tax=Syphacia muris TaxID=451379 RepID=A0A158R652_9BILA